MKRGSKPPHIIKLLYFEWSPPWHSIHPTWHSVWQIFWHSIWQIFWHSIWNIFLAFHLACLLTFYLAYLRTFYLEYLLTFYLAYLLTLYLACLSGILSGISSDILSGILSGILFGILHGFVSGRWSPVEVRRGPRRAESRRLGSREAHNAPILALWGPARPTALRLAGWGPASPLRSRAGSGGPARPTAIKMGAARPIAIKSCRSGKAHCAIESWQWRTSEVHCDQELAEEVRRGWRSRKRRRRRRRRESDIKSNNPHLAGGEKSGTIFGAPSLGLGHSLGLNCLTWHGSVRTSIRCRRFPARTSRDMGQQGKELEIWPGSHGRFLFARWLSVAEYWRVKPTFSATEKMLQICVE